MGVQAPDTHKANAEQREEVNMKKKFTLRGKCDSCFKETEVRAAPKQGEWICEECEINLQFRKLFGDYLDN